MHHPFALRASIIVGCVLSIASGARGQCLDWDERFSSTGTNGVVNAMAVFDDGTGPALYVGGSFTVAGKVAASNVAKWNGSGWSPLTRGADDVVNALCVFDDGSGPALYAGGNFILAGNVTANRVAKWDGSSWSALAGGFTGVDGCCSAVTSVRALAVYDDGSGPALFAAGHFTMANGMPALSIAKWNGASWSSVGGGLDNSSPNASIVNTLCVFDDGTGSKLFAAGSFNVAGGVASDNIVKWNGTSWSALAGGQVNSTPHAITVFDDGTGPALFVGGFFTTAGGLTVNKIAKWNGATWLALGSGIGGIGPTVLALAVFDDGSGDRLYVGGSFTSAGGIPANCMAKWNGSSWSSVANGMNSFVNALTVFDDGAGAELYAGGQFTVADGVVSAQIAKWSGTSWSALSPTGMGLSDTANALLVYDDGSGPALYAAGGFTIAGSTAANGLAKWSGSSWTGSGIGTAGPAYALAPFDDGSGPALYVGGSFQRAGGLVVKSIARWDGANWSIVGGGLHFGADVYALCAFDDGSGPALYAGGEIDVAADGAVNVTNIAKWNGTNWFTLGAGLNGHNTAWVYSLIAFDDGGGPALFAGGAFDSSGAIDIGRVGKWDDGVWTEVGGGIGTIFSTVYALAVFDDGTGSALYAAGDFTQAGGNSANFIAKFDDAGWSALGTGTNGVVRALGVFDDGTGTALYVGGDFTTAGGVSAIHLAKWNGASWSAVGSGVDGSVRALASFDDGFDGAPDLYAGGAFAMVGDRPSLAIAEWHGCPPGAAYCFGDGIDSVVTASCPCGNVGSPGRGCANSNASLGGARLIASGTTNPNTVVLSCTGVNNNTLCTFFRGPNHDPQAAVFGDGIKCINPPIFRFGQQSSGQGGNPAFTVAVPAPTELPGSTFHYAVHYRNPTAGFCDPGLFNASNGYTVSW